MQKKYIVRLTDQEREELTQVADNWRSGFDPVG